MKLNSDMIFLMELMKEESRHTIEPQFLSQAQTTGVKVRIGLMNKTEHEGIIRDIGRYELNLEENSRTVTLLKQEISFVTAPHALLATPLAAAAQELPAPEPPAGRPNIQQEFLDKAITENQVLTLFLINGLRIKASIDAYDNFTILLNEGGRQHLYYKHAITTINR
jgi:host factor-I protein